MPGETETVQTTQQNSPFLPNLGHLQGGWDEASRLYNQGGGGNAGLDQYITGLQSRINDPAYQVRQSQARDTGYQVATGELGWKPTQTLQDFESGKFLSPETNPWLKGAYDDAAGALRGQINGQFAGAGRYASGANQDILGQNLGKLANQFYGGAYQQGQQQRLQASTLMNQLQDTAARTRLTGAAMYPQMLTASDADSRGLADATQRRQDAPWQNLQRYLSAINSGQNFGGSSSTQTPTFSNPFGQAIDGIGGALSALNLGRQAFGNPFDWFSSGGGSSWGFDPSTYAGLLSGSSLASDAGQIGSGLLPGMLT